MFWMTGVYYGIGFLAGTIALHNIYRAAGIDCKTTRWVVSTMMLLVILRYAGMIIFGLGMEWHILEHWKRSLLFSSVAIPISFFFTIRHLYGRKRVTANRFMLRLFPLLLFYLLFIATAKVSVIPSAFMGYEIRLDHYWKLGLGFVQGMVLLCIGYSIFRAMGANKDEEARIRLIFLNIPLMLLILDGLAQVINIPFLQPLSISEVMAVIAVGYGLSYKN